MTNETLESEYHNFLRQNGLKPYKPNHSHAQFERLDQKRKTASGAEGVETDLPKEVQDALSDVIATNEMTFQRVVRFLVTQIESVVEPCLGIQPLKDIFAGEFPTGSFNALAAPVKNGTLLLMNTGAMALISKLIRLMVINIFEHLIGNISPQEYFKDQQATFNFKSGQSPLSVAELVERIALCVFGYVISDNALSLPNLPILGGPQRISWAHLTLSTEKFIIAHEYGHALAGHLSSARSGLHSREIGGLKIYKKLWDDEFEADLLGARLVLCEARNPWASDKAVNISAVDSNELIRARESFAVSGVLIFFAIDRIVTTVSRALYPENPEATWSDHPPSEERSERLLDFFKGEKVTEAIQAANELTSWLRDVGTWTTMLAQGVAESEADPDNRPAALMELIPVFSSALGGKLNEPLGNVD
jgi:hypothetical protein